MSSGYGPPAPKEVAVARPSSSVLLISPKNEILLLHRVRGASSFASAHVFPGGNVDSFHDGQEPASSDSARHVDGPVYRRAAIRETFEESGILLARNNGFGRLIEVDDVEREEGRRLVHEGKVSFEKWLASKGGRADVDGLIPFTRWVTPANLPRRFTTQMYLYFLPTVKAPAVSGSILGVEATGGRQAVIPIPTHDGGQEHTEARFLPAQQWIDMAQGGEIILFPPQLFLLHLIAPFLMPSSGQQTSEAVLTDQRTKLRHFLQTSDPPWGDKCISPIQFMKCKSDGRTVLSLEKPGHELAGSERQGEKERVVLVNFKKEGPRNVEVRWRKDVLESERGDKESAKL